MKYHLLLTIRETGFFATGERMMRKRERKSNEYTTRSERREQKIGKKPEDGKKLDEIKHKSRAHTLCQK